MGGNLAVPIPETIATALWHRKTTLKTLDSYVIVPCCSQAR
ncbi:MULTISPECIES: hypothetical protein [unclassified Prochlorococcus]|nr:MULTISPECIES: hypothetical protein [unclassified Prochlorococcus]KGG29339.1 hypothetical protein EV12_0196 [Prochlorococcus sp. MIT 0701]KGG30525.1 hypothetical protein EV13_0185 [Prochlorococcus sp. MIT 0702]KGG37041.1 hypothetical protein EV14_0141 [Prochlorococcus sp. MIT 0703]